MKNYRLNFLLFAFLLLCQTANCLATESSRPNPNFHIYLCFGQSNMQGKGRIEDRDKADVPERFRMMAAVDFPTMNRKQGEWYTAVPPLCRPETGLCPADYFGREMVKNLPDSISVGIINVAVDGCSIEMFDEDVCQGYIKGQPSYMTSAAAAYDNNPFRRLVDLGRKAQQDGVIKGILIHQGETNMGNDKWGMYVNRIYLRMLAELGLDASEVPLIAGEMLRAEYGGVCANHIPAVNALYHVIPNSMVASSEGCKAGDQYHFNSDGYRIIGRRYAKLMLKYLEAYQTTCSVEASAIRAQEEAIEMLPATYRRLHILSTDAEGNETDVTSACQFTVDNPSLLSIEGNKIVTAQQTGSTLVTATLTDAAGQQHTTTFSVNVSLWQFNSTFDPALYMDGKLTEVTNGYSLKSATNGFGGWVFQQGIDLSATPFVHLDMNTKPSSNSKILVYDQPDFMAPRFFKNINTARQITIDLRQLKDSSGKPLDIEQIHFLGFCFGTNPTMSFKSVTLTSTEEEVDALSETTILPASATYHDLQGRIVTPHQRGLYIRNDKKVILK